MKTTRKKVIRTEANKNNGSYLGKFQLTDRSKLTEHVRNIPDYLADIVDVKATQGARDTFSSLRELKENWHILRDAHRASLSESLAEAYLWSVRLRADPDLWLEFYSLPFWKEARQKPSPAKPEQAVRHVLRYLIGLGAKQRRRVSKYRRALEPSFEQGVPPREFKEKIMQLGIGKLTKESALSKKPKKPKEPTIKAPEFILSGPMIEKIGGMNEGDVFVAKLVVGERKAASISLIIKSIKEKKKE